MNHKNITAEQVEALDVLCDWIETIEELHENLKAVEKRKDALCELFGEAEIELLQITTQGAIHRMLGSTPETQQIRNILPRLDEAVASRRSSKKNNWDGKH